VNGNAIHSETFSNDGVRRSFEVPVLAATLKEGWNALEMTVDKTVRHGKGRRPRGIQVDRVRILHDKAT
jgi:hypothetical protein